jgi:hypothetical protein
LVDLEEKDFPINNPPAAATMEIIMDIMVI